MSPKIHCYYQLTVLIPLHSLIHSSAFLSPSIEHHVPPRSKNHLQFNTSIFPFFPETRDTPHEFHIPSYENDLTIYLLYLLRLLQSLDSRNSAFISEVLSTHALTSNLVCSVIFATISCCLKPFCLNNLTYS